MFHETRCCPAAGQLGLNNLKLWWDDPGDGPQDTYRSMPSLEYDSDDDEALGYTVYDDLDRLASYCDHQDDDYYKGEFSRTIRHDIVTSITPSTSPPSPVHPTPTIDSKPKFNYRPIRNPPPDNHRSPNPGCSHPALSPSSGNFIGTVSQREDGQSDGEWEATDDVKGGPLPVSLVKEARAKECSYLMKHGVYEYASIADCIRVTGRRPLGLKWIDTNKGGPDAPLVRSRLVCTEVRRPGLEPIFAATPPLDTLRASLVKAASRWGRTGKDLKIQLIDVSRAHFYAQSVRDVYVRLPAEDPRHGEAGLCGKLVRTMYGTLDAAEQWARHYTEVLEAAGFTCGASNPCHFWHESRDIWMLVHGDDFLTISEQDDQDFVYEVLNGKYEIKRSMAGPGPKDDKHLKALGRIISCTSDGWQLEAGPQHVEVAATHLGLENAKGVATPMATDNGSISAGALKKIRLLLDSTFSHNGGGSKDACGDNDDCPLPPNQLKLYQSVSARLNYLALDRPDVGHSVKELMRKMSSPTSSDMCALKRVVRYLLSMPRVANLYGWSPLTSDVVVFGDANWAGCIRTRKSTLGGFATWGGLPIKTWSRTMSILALSSAVLRASSHY